MMSQLTSSQNAAAVLVTVELYENNISGVALSAPLEGHAISELKWWLLCQGINSLKKAQLMDISVTPLDWLGNDGSDSSNLEMTYVHKPCTYHPA